MNIHLAKVSRSVTHGAHAVLVLDQAGWHTSPQLHVPENISLLPSPAYAPELNRVEQVWARLAKGSGRRSRNTVQLGGFPDHRTARHRRLVRCRRTPDSPN